MLGKKAQASSGFIIRLIGAGIASIGFFLLAYQQTVIGTALVGIGALFIAVGEA